MMFAFYSVNQYLGEGSLSLLNLIICGWEKQLHQCWKKSYSTP